MQLLAGLLRSLEAAEVRPAVNLMLGRGPGIKTGVSWAALIGAARAAFGDRAIDFSQADGYVDAGEVVRQMAAQGGGGGGGAAGGQSILDVQRGFEAVAEARGRKAKERLLAELLATGPDEAAWIGRNAVGEMRTGAQEGLLLEAIAAAVQLPAHEVRRALIGASDVAAVAEAALSDARDGGDRLAGFGIRVGATVPPMLAETAATLRDAYVALQGRLALEWKLDGARVQIHKDGDRVQLWSRRMTDVTARLPDVAEAARVGVRAERAILEGEVIVAGADGRPIPFQDVMRRWLRQVDAEGAAGERPASVFLFDCLYVDDIDGEAMLDRPYLERWQALERVSGALPTMPRLVIEGPPDAPSPDVLAQMQRFYDAAIDAGHEGVMAKALDAAYAPGRRGAHWLKVKAETTLDLAIVGADWGTGRRHKWLSNYHLACRDETTGEFLSVGETFKGLTDAEFEAMTAQLLALKTGQRGGYVSVEPRVVVEVTFNGVQRSTRLPSGVALRFARITAIRDDKPAEQVETLRGMRSLLPAVAQDQVL